MAGIGDLTKLFGKGSIAEQLLVWGLLQQLLGTAFGPEMQLLERAVNEVLQATPLTPADLADMVNRAIVSEGDGEAYAKQSGIAPSDFKRLVEAAGNAISPQEAVLAFRRGLIPRAGRGPDSLSLEQAIAESRVKDKWVGTIEKLGAQPLPVADAVDAAVESQVTFEEGAAWAAKSGVDREVYQILVDTRGNPPSPTELNVLHKRGLIELEGTGPDATSVQQGIFEGATKNKWWRLLAALSDYIPPPRTVTALVREGSITDEQALRYYQWSGLSQELATAYLHSAHHLKLQATKDLAKAEVDTLYHDQLIDAKAADAMYSALGYSPEEQAFLRSIQDMRRAVTATTQAISRVHALYVARKIDWQTASNALDALHVPSAQRDQLHFTWDIERDANVKRLSAAEIASAFNFNIIDQATATEELVADGYSEREAWILLSVRKHHPLPNVPAGVRVPPRG